LQAVFVFTALDKNLSIASDAPPHLTEIVSVWPELLEHIKVAIKALVQSSV